ncbi:hypothetical protein M378DRAFT_18078 [Amanita muscaria Koide BX008]|uniref:Uncharacterized protein n=1 Tax=Amanita muscaria (strain Koide BX008) TaxID=946122 RepID=A0A0C2W2F9_AMAMK|nr:hypothetical protein M378DRAFT_18078 [Amanita muscaria Koide BX008]
MSASPAANGAVILKLLAFILPLLLDPAYRDNDYLEPYSRLYLQANNHAAHPALESQLHSTRMMAVATYNPLSRRKNVLSVS